MDSSTALQLIDLDIYLSDPTSPAAQAECKKVALAFQSTGALVLKAPSSAQLQASSNSEFLDLFEDYFNQPQDLLEQDERPQFGYQVGATLEGTEKPKCHSSDDCKLIISKLDPEERPLSNEMADPKCRFFWRMGETPPYESKFSQQYMPNVVPKGFEEVWQEKCESYGSLLKSGVESIAKMLALGLGLDGETFTDAGRYGPHLLAPTATSLGRYGQKDSIFAGFHSDLNFLTIHGQSRYPGLHIWARNSGKRLVAKVPEGCLLVQAGKQLEIMTGGLILAGFHEVVCTDATLAAIERRKASYPDRPLWRISSTFFWHLSSDQDISPIPKLSNCARDLRVRNGEDSEEDPYKEWHEKKAGDEVLYELGLINLL